MEPSMELSARNQIRGTIRSVELGGLLAEVVVDIGGGQQITSVITLKSAERLALKEGQEVVAVIKATEVIIGKTMKDFP
jgi:molybdopterin-binding protein